MVKYCLIPVTDIGIAKFQVVFEFGTRIYLYRSILSMVHEIERDR